MVSSGLAPWVDRGRVHVGLKEDPTWRSAWVRAIEFRFVEITAPHHGFDFAGGVVDGDQSALCTRVLFQADGGGAVGPEAEHSDVAEIAGLNRSWSFL